MHFPVILRVRRFLINGRPVDLRRAYFNDECPFYNGDRHGNLPLFYVKWPVTNGHLRFLTVNHPLLAASFFWIYGESPSIDGYFLCIYGESPSINVLFTLNSRR